MKICRFNQNRLGLLEGDTVLDVTDALQVLPPVGWPAPLGDPLLLHLAQLTQAIERLRAIAPRLKLAEVALQSPITQPTKVMAAPANYALHVALDVKDPAIDNGLHQKALEGVARPVEKYGLFLKANSSVVGPADGVSVVLPDRRTDHEVELGVIIGKQGRNITRAEAMDHVAAYCIGLDMTVRGVEDRSYRKSPDSYTVLGPAIVTKDEISDPYALNLSLWVNSERKQHTSAGAMTVDIADLIEFASRVYTLYPGDVILTGTPEGVGPVKPGDVIRAACDGVGEMTVLVRAYG